MSINHDVYEDLIQQHKDHLRKKYQDYPEQLKKMLKLLDQALDELRDQAIATVREETRVRIIKRWCRKLIRTEIERSIGHLIADVEKQMRLAAEERSLMRFQEAISKLHLFLDSINELEQEIINQPIRPFDWIKYRMNIHIREKEPYHCYWIGADVYITTGPVKNYTGSKIVCVTHHADMLTRLFRRIAETDPDAINYINKYEFYGRMALAVNDLYEKNSEPPIKEVWLAALAEAKILLNRWLFELADDLEFKQKQHQETLLT